MSNKVYAGNLSDSTTEDELREAFAAYGDVVSVRIVTDRAGYSRGLGYVEMSTEKEIVAAINGMHRTQFGGRKIRVAKARSH